MTLTKALFGVSSCVEVQPEITSEFIRMGLKGVDKFRKYLFELGYSENKLEEILLEIYDEVKRRCVIDDSHRELFAEVCLEVGSFYLGRCNFKAECFLLESYNLRVGYYGDSLRAGRLATVMTRLGMLYAKDGANDKAEVMFEDSYMIYRELYERYGVYERDYAVSANNLGNFYFDLYMAEEALEYFFEAVEHKSVLGGVVTLVYYNIALAYGDIDVKRSVDYYFKAACSEFLYKIGVVDIERVLSKAFRVSGDLDIYAFYVGYLVSEGLMTVDKAKDELSGLTLFKFKDMFGVLDNGEEAGEVQKILRRIALDALEEKENK